MSIYFLQDWNLMLLNKYLHFIEILTCAFRAQVNITFLLFGFGSPPIKIFSQTYVDVISFIGMLPISHSHHDFSLKS